MAYPTYITPRSIPGAATPAYLTATLASGYSTNQTLTVNSTAGWYEVSSSGTLSSNPLGTNGIFTLVVDYGSGNEEKILCSGVVSIGSNVPINIWSDGVYNGRGWDGTPVSAHASGTNANYNVFPVRTAVDDLQFNTSAITVTNNLATLSGQYVTSSGILTTATGNIASLSGSLATLSGQYVSTSGSLTTLSGQYVTSSGILTTATGNIATISGKQVTDEANIATLSGQMVTANANIASTSGSLATLSGQFVTLSGQYATTSGIVTTTTGNVASLSGSLATLSGQFVTLSGQYNTTSGIVTTATGNIASLSVSLNTVSGVAYAALPRSGGTISGNLVVASGFTVSGTATFATPPSIMGKWVSTSLTSSIISITTPVQNINVVVSGYTNYLINFDMQGINGDTTTGHNIIAYIYQGTSNVAQKTSYAVGNQVVSIHVTHLVTGLSAGTAYTFYGETTQGGSSTGTVQAAEIIVLGFN